MNARFFLRILWARDLRIESLRALTLPSQALGWILGIIISAWRPGILNIDVSISRDAVPAFRFA